MTCWMLLLLLLLILLYCDCSDGKSLAESVLHSVQAAHISQASPAWQDYVDYTGAIVLDGLRQSCLSSQKAMLNQVVKSNQRWLHFTLCARGGYTSPSVPDFSCCTTTWIVWHWCSFGYLSQGHVFMLQNPCFQCHNTSHRSLVLKTPQ